MLHSRKYVCVAVLLNDLFSDPSQLATLILLREKVLYRSEITKRCLRSYYDGAESRGRWSRNENGYFSISLLTRSQVQLWFSVNELLMLCSWISRWTIIERAIVFHLNYIFARKKATTRHRPITNQLALNLNPMPVTFTSTCVLNYIISSLAWSLTPAHAFHRCRRFVWQ